MLADLKLGTGPRDLTIRDLRKKLASRKIDPALDGQNATRHRAVLQLLYYQHRLENEGTWNSQTRLSGERGHWDREYYAS